MKKIIVLFLVMLLGKATFAQQPSNINGTTDPNTVKKVSLGKVLNGHIVEIGTSIPDSLGRFAFRFTPEYEGLYTLTMGNTNSTLSVLRFYFKGNDDLNLTVTPTFYELVGKNSKENQTLYQWDLLAKDMREKGLTPGGMSTYVDFFPEVEAMKVKLDGMKAKAKTGNNRFDTFFVKLVDYDVAFYAISYLYMPRTVHPGAEEMSDYYTTFQADNFLTPDLLRFPYGDRLLPILMYRKIDFKDKPTLADQVNAIPADVLKGQYILQYMDRTRSYSDYIALNDEYAKYLTLPEQIERANAVATKLVDTKEGTKAFNFNYPDLSGKNISLADLKGKVVVVDVWATWCGPCKAEEPHWEKLNEEFEDKDVVFVGVSVDQDKKAWEKYVPEKNLKGIQLHAGSDNDLSKAYKITGIPRYLVIDKAGNIITPDSPRPSDPKLKELLNTWLAK
ncbi:TlpA family protein disulfide reductase [Sphingobacterium lumbrici]|uniref:TlpA family protein disulfide reductase n=1 Tax=Sphingobacterium lumbrici TaxID=2559600 RepID=UPI001F3EE2A9|nr:TlpA disulfide reductase family protein [Sphingobacterium lumbrici]